MLLKPNIFLQCIFAHSFLAFKPFTKGALFLLISLETLVKFKVRLPVKKNKRNFFLKILSIENLRKVRPFWFVWEISSYLAFQGLSESIIAESNYLKQD